MVVARQILRRPLYWLLALLPVAVLLPMAGASPTIILLAAALAIIPLAGLLGESTEVLAAYSGPRVGGLLNATLGNAAELIITIIAIREGLLELVKASITGSTQTLRSSWRPALPDSRNDDTSGTIAPLAAGSGERTVRAHSQATTPAGAPSASRARG